MDVMFVGLFANVNAILKETFENWLTLEAMDIGLHSYADNLK